MLFALHKERVCATRIKIAVSITSSSEVFIGSSGHEGNKSMVIFRSISVLLVEMMVLRQSKKKVGGGGMAEEGHHTYFVHTD